MNLHLSSSGIRGVRVTCFYVIELIAVFIKIIKSVLSSKLSFYLTSPCLPWRKEMVS